MSELKAVHFMTHFNGEYDAFYPKAEADKVIEEKDKEIAELKDAQRWRKCSEEKPQDGQVVWAYEANNDRVLVLEYEKNDEGEGFICFSYKRDFYRSITHWMPYNKPKAPKVEKRNCENCLQCHEIENKGTVYKVFCKQVGHWMEWNKEDNCTEFLPKEAK